MFFTLTGCHHYFGTDVFEKGMQVTLVKEPDNEHDREAIRVQVPGLGKVGYVANSPYTVKGESWSAGRIYDKIGDEVTAQVVFIIPGAVICEIPDQPRRKSRRKEK